jgi:hypothetical protein
METKLLTPNRQNQSLPSLLTKEWILPAATVTFLDKYYILKWSRKFFLLSLVQDGDDTTPDQIAHQGTYYDVYYKGGTRYEDVILSEATTVMLSFRKTKDSSTRPAVLVKLCNVVSTERTERTERTQPRY